MERRWRGDVRAGRTPSRNQWARTQSDLTEAEVGYHSDHKEQIPAGLAEAPKMGQTTRGGWRKWTLPRRMGTAALGEPILTASEMRRSHGLRAPRERHHPSGQRMVTVHYWQAQNRLVLNYLLRAHVRDAGPNPHLQPKATPTVQARSTAPIPRGSFLF